MAKETYTIAEAAVVAGVRAADIEEAIRVGALLATKLQNTGDHYVRHVDLMSYMRHVRKDAFSLDGVDRKRILIVDDEYNFANIMQLQFERDRRFEVKIATGGNDAVNLARQLTPDLILLDFMLPDTTGEKILETVRREMPNADIKVIVYSAHTEEAIRQVPDLEARLARLGAAAFVSKSIGMKPLLQKVYEVLGYERPTQIRRKPTL